MSEVLTCPKCGTKLKPRCQLSDGLYETTCKCGHELRFKRVDIPAAKIVSAINFTVNGKAYTVQNPSPTMTLNEWLRTVANLKGTKRSCGEGGCGACVLMLSRYDSVAQKTVHISVNSCLRLLCSVDGWAITTVEGVGSRETSYNAIQTALAKYNGSQCGFCSPGMVMNMYSLLAANPNPTSQQIEDLFDGNLCRCTGYRPILDAMKTLAVDALAPPDVEEIGRVRATVPCCALPCARDCGAASAQSKLVIVKDGAQWVRPNSLAELLSTIASQSQSYRLVCGNTSVGVFKNQPAADVYIDVSVIPELRTLAYASQTLTAGASVTINELIAGLLANTSASASYPRLASHLSIVANVAVRNAGSWAGNLMMAHNFPNFPSDIFTTMAGAGATVQISSPSAQPVSVDLFSFLQTDMSKRVLTALNVPTLQAGESFVSYKVMPRHTNAHAYVNAAFRIRLDANGVVQSLPTIVYGGIAAFACLASRTAAYLVGKNLSDPATLSGAMTTLQSELVPDTPPVASSAAYRVSLACALLYKTIVSLVNASPRVKSAGQPYVRAISSGQDSYDTDPTEYPVSQPAPKLEALIQAAGEAKYTDDLPITAGMLFAAFMLADKANATIATIDVTQVLAATGVARVITAADLKFGTNFVPAMAGVAEPLFVAIGQTTDYAGQGVGIVLADTQAHADVAAALVALTYSSVKAPILTIQQAEAAGAYFQCPLQPVQAGKPIATALAESTHVLSGEISCDSQYHLHMETQSSQATPTDDGGISLHSSTQWLDMTQRSAAMMTGLPAGKVRVTIPRIGGAYGGKITRSLMVSSAVAIATSLTGVPVRCVLSLATNMAMIGKRNPFLCRYSAGFADDGQLQAVKLDYIEDCGCSPSDSIGTMSMALTICDNAYSCPNWLVTPYLVKTNHPTNTACRAPGVCPAVFFIETMMDDIAAYLKINPEAVRGCNLYRQGQTTPYAQPLPYCSLPTIWPQAIVSMDFQNRRAAVDSFNASNRWRKRGISIAPQKYGLAWNADNMSAYVAIYGHDGSVVVQHSGVESGQGINTKVAQVVAYALGVPLSMVSVELPSIFGQPNANCTGGSVTSELCCMAAQAACTILNGRLDAVRKTLPPSATWMDVINKCVQTFVDISARGWVAPTTSTVFQYNSYGVVCTEVELDVLTGEQQILRADILFDCGQSLNPAVDVGQVHGAFLMGLGYFTTEELKYDPTTGVILTDGTWEYKPPAVKDIPIDLRVTLLPNSPNPAGFLRSKASGEPPLCMAANVVLALQYAVRQALAELPSPPASVRINAPATVEHLQTACLVSPTQFAL